MEQTINAPCEHASEGAESIPWLRRRLLSWFQRNGRSFPWRESGMSSYELTVAEILLQRTTAAGVARAYCGFIKRYPSRTALAQSPIGDIEGVLRPLGLWRQKAMVFKRLANSIEGSGGLVPHSRRELERMPGIGPYTASAVLAMVYGQNEPLLDVNMARLLRRFLGAPECAEPGTGRWLHAPALLLVSCRRSLQVNWAVLDFGALVCRARRPHCMQCPLQTRCQYFAQTQLQFSPAHQKVTRRGQRDG